MIDPTTDTAAPDAPVHEPWLRAVGTAVTNGELSVEAARAIRTGLGEPTLDDNGVGVTADQLAGAAGSLLAVAVTLNADQLYKQARALRDDLDEAGIADREKAIYQERSFRRVKRANGPSRFILDPDLETSAILMMSTTNSPHHAGAGRASSMTRTRWAEGIANDERTTDQYLHDAVTALLRLGVTADQADGHPITGSRVPAVRVLVTADTLETRSGHDRIEGVDIPVSIETVERTICTAGTRTIEFGDNGQPLDLGREVRLFNNRQKIALSVRDGGCMWPGCDRKPTWTEAHHTKHWKRDHGRTDVADGICLCRHHHMLLHDNHWEIIRRGASYWLIPPPDIDCTQTPRPLASKSAALRDLQREHSRRTGQFRRTAKQGDLGLAGPPT